MTPVRGSLWHDPRRAADPHGCGARSRHLPATSPSASTPHALTGSPDADDGIEGCSAASEPAQRSRPVITRSESDSDSDSDSARHSQYVVYSADTHRFARLLDNMDAVRPEKANLIIVELTDGPAVDSWEDGKIKLVAPIQGLIDAFGIGGSLERAAERIARSW